MKNLILIIGIICFVANLLLGLIISSYAPFNLVLNSFVILINTGLMYAIAASSVKDGFKVSLSMLFPMCGLIEYILGLFASNTFENNWYLILTVIILFIESILFAVVYGISHINK